MPGEPQAQEFDETPAGHITSLSLKPVTPGQVGLADWRTDGLTDWRTDGLADYGLAAADVEKGFVMKTRREDRGHDPGSTLGEAPSETKVTGRPSGGTEQKGPVPKRLTARSPEASSRKRTGVRGERGPQTVGAQRGSSPHAQITSRCCQGPGPPILSPQKPDGAGAILISVLPIRNCGWRARVGAGPGLSPAPSAPEWRCFLLLRHQTHLFCPLAPHLGQCPPLPLRSQPPGSGWCKGESPGPFPLRPALRGSPRASALRNLQEMKDGPGCCRGNHSSFIDGPRTHLLQLVESNLQVLVPSGRLR